jgi:hypothetical protein
MAFDYKEFQPHQYKDFADLDRRAAEVIDLRAVLSDEAYGELAENAGRICLDDIFLRRETLVYLELPDDHPARRYELADYIEERMTDQMIGEYPKSTL